MKKRIAIITTHPIQYNAPLFGLLSSRSVIESKVFYTWGKESMDDKYDHGFGKKVKWDIDLLSGYHYEFLENISKDKGSHHFNGIDNPDLIEKINAFQPDAILVFGWPLKSHLKAMRHFKGKLPVYFRGDSVLKKSDGFLKKLLKKIYISWVYRFVDIAFYAGEKNKSYFLEYGLKENQLIYAPHAINNLFFETQLSMYFNRCADWRTKLSIKSDEVVFMYAGKLDVNKNTAFLCDCFIALNNENCHLVIVGDGIEKDRLMKLYSKKENIHFLSFQNQSEIPFLYGMADVFVLPSHNETWGLSVNEAMVCGCSILLSSAVGCAPDLVVEGVTGFVFELNDKEDLIKKMKVLSNKNIAAEMGENSVVHVKEWNYERICVALESEMLKN